MASFKIKPEPKGHGHVEPGKFPAPITTYDGQIELPGGKLTDGQDSDNHAGETAGKPFGPVQPPEHKPFKVKGG